MPNKMYFQSRPDQLSFQETKLIPHIIQGVKSIYPDLSLSTTEVESGFGIADVVIYNLDKNTAKSRQRRGIPRIRSFEVLETLTLIGKEKSDIIGITQLYQQLPYSENIFRTKILDFILGNNIAEIRNGKDLLLKYKYKVALQETIAIEAKVSNWKRGLYQAYRYKQYSDMSYLALHSSHIGAPMKNIDLFKQLNVGLISVDPIEELTEILFKPSSENSVFASWTRSYANESLLTANGYVIE